MKERWYKKIFANTFIGCIAIFIASLIAAILLFVLVSLIPSTAIHNNIESSADILEQESADLQTNLGNKPIEWDNFTTDLMLKMSYSANSLKDILLGHSFVGSFQDVLNASGQMSTYSQYWHGWVVILKPLLMFFNLAQIRIIFLAFSLLLLLGICIHLTRQKHFLFACVITLAFVFIDGTIAVQNLSLAFSFFIAFGSCLWVCKHKKRNGSIFFSQTFIYAVFLTGITLAFFDFLCTPLLTLSIPLATAIVLDKNMLMESKVSRTIVRFIVLCLVWACGYLLFWALKWLIVLLFFDPNFITNLKSIIAFRSAGNEEYPLSRKTAVVENIKLAYSKKFIVCALIAAIIFCVWGFNRREKSIRVLIPVALLLALAISPEIWNAFIAANHSQIHAFFTYRTQMITMVALPWALFMFVKWHKQ